MSEILGAITALGHLTNVCKTLYQAHTQTEMDAVKIELQKAVLDLQASYQGLAESNEALKKKLAEYEQWDKEAARYELKQLLDGIYAYALKAGQENGQPPHLLCPHCFGERKRSLLLHPNPNSKNFVCHACKLQICLVPPVYAAVI